MSPGTHGVIVAGASRWGGWFACTEWRPHDGLVDNATVKVTAADETSVVDRMAAYLKRVSIPFDPSRVAVLGPEWWHPGQVARHHHCRIGEIPKDLKVRGRRFDVGAGLFVLRYLESHVTAHQGPAPVDTSKLRRKYADGRS